ncbi:MAG TPA: aminotransferase class V-fold PLP-dependent enzyme [Polyangiaceae bacterium]|nr:aminotransferase class V-fold PLP-dependent enzyme [Polyangiaceae bacterium]
MPDEVFSDLNEYTQTLLLRSRSLELWLSRMYELIDLLESFLNAPPGTVALRDSSTACHAAIASALEPSAERNRILTVQGLHFKSTRYLWESQEARGFSLLDVEAEAEWTSAEALCSKIDERTAIVAVPLVSAQTGALLPVAEIAARARDAGALTIVDAYQGVGIVPVDVRALGVDVVIAGTHKWMCGADMGLAFMYASRELCERLVPKYPGWVGHADLKTVTPRFVPAQGAQRFQQGSPAMEPIYTARAGLRFLLEVGVEALRARSLFLTQRLIDGARERGFRLLTPVEAERRGGMLCIDLADPDRIANALAAERIDVDTRPGAGLRVGPYPCLDESECEHLLDRLAVLSRA